MNGTSRATNASTDGTSGRFLITDARQRESLPVSRRDAPKLRQALGA
jgi:hypothetical protein